MMMKMNMCSIILLSSKVLGGGKWVVVSTTCSRGGAAAAAATATGTSTCGLTKKDKKVVPLVKAKGNREAAELDIQSENSTTYLFKGNNSIQPQPQPQRPTEDENREEVWSKQGIGRRRRQVIIRRSGLLAKQVIAIQSALSLGFVSQIWVDTTSWVVLVVEVRHNLLTGESERFLLHDITQVGDVVLVQDDFVLDTQLPMLGLHSLVGYRVVTPNHQTIGKVRGYSFNIESGAVESLELDSFGISIIPSSLVSTYRLLVEDVMEVLPDAVIVHEAAASRIQRLTKGFWDTQKSESSTYEVDEYSAHGSSTRSDQNINSWKSQKFHPTTRKPDDDWEPPMDYL